MNERIRELAEQAGAIIFSEQTRSGDWVDFSDYTGFDHTKFAELIVKECADVAWMNTPETEELEYSHLIEGKILKHFGVQE